MPATAKPALAADLINETGGIVSDFTVHTVAHAVYAAQASWGGEYSKGEANGMLHVLRQLGVLPVWGDDGTTFLGLRAE